jgi:hypothetical protein
VLATNILVHDYEMPIDGQIAYFVPYLWELYKHEQIHTASGPISHTFMPTTTVYDAKQKQLDVEKEFKAKQVQMISEEINKEYVEEKKKITARKPRSNYDREYFPNSIHLFLCLSYSALYVVIYRGVFSVVIKKQLREL